MRERDAWAATRQTVLARDGFHCQDCSDQIDRSELDVHHLVPRAMGGTDEPSNLVTLCDGCHARRHPNLQVSLSRRMIERWAIRIARLLDSERELPHQLPAIGTALRLVGKSQFREGQLDAVLAALRGESVLVVRPTGSGKSLCFQVPALLTGGTTFVLSPLKALMKDQVVELQRLKLPSTFINGDLGPTEKKARYELLEQGSLRFLYCTPERFNPARVLPEEVARLARAKAAFLVVDEAHCVDRWGRDFRPDYGRIAEIRTRLGNPPVLAFTATAGAEAQTRILASLGLPTARRLVSGADRPNIALVRHQASGDVRSPGSVRTRAKTIANLVRHVRTGKAMIFVPTVKIGELLQSSLALEELDLPFYHSKFGTANERDVLIGRFTGRLEPALDAIICTNAFGMGIDVPNVRLVINWQHPASVEDYLQEFGRAGRDGKPALAVLLTDGGRETNLLKFMARKTAGASSGSSPTALETRLAEIDKISAVVRRPGCFRRNLLDLLGANRSPRSSLSKWLLELVFTRRARVARPSFCCDFCDPKKARSALAVASTPHA
ncbi:MAG: RecQ family ATP-dependent DNA helicase [Deltaproteobacteria bacterium]|nr:RecQ family ATP-dependent DNA helicase [Deltaproteobacteria bacterium]